MGLIANRTDITWTPIRNNDISWNFAKWLISSNGHPYRRYTSRTTPKMLEDDILHLLNECVNSTVAAPPPPPPLAAQRVVEKTTVHINGPQPGEQPATQPLVAQKQKRHASHEKLRPASHEELFF